MKHSVAVKFVAMLLTALAFVCAVGSGIGIVVLEQQGLYSSDMAQYQSAKYDDKGYILAWQVAKQYAAGELGDCPESVLQRLYGDAVLDTKPLNWAAMITLDGERLTGYQMTDSDAIIREYTIMPRYPKAERLGEISAIPSYSTPESEEPTQVTWPQQPETYDEYESVIQVLEGTVWVRYGLNYFDGPEYVVTVSMLPEIVKDGYTDLLSVMYDLRYAFIAMLTAGLVIFAVGAVYLACAAGHTSEGTIRPAGLNRLPLDLYGGIAAAGVTFLVWLMVSIADWSGGIPNVGVMSLLITLAVLTTLLALGFFFALSAQVKVKTGFWWRHSILGWIGGKLWSAVRFGVRAVNGLVGLLPVMWQWLLVGGILGIGVIVTVLLAYTEQHNWFLFLWLLLCVAVVCYGGYAFGTLMLGVRRMTRGNLSYKVPTRYLWGSFRDMAEQLNTLSETAKVAAQKQMRAERMRSELITNVSHDIKTPLTSIINFVDLLKKPHTDQEETRYLDVLSRQSDRMKRLIEDLMELSKASTGNITVKIETLDAVESVNQALGEFSDKLDSAGLAPVFHPPQEPVHIKADGRLMWRVLSNLLSNAVKYAMPGTRLYVDLVRLEDRVLLSVKNISREELNISADELLERFVRGDASRNSEGSGLGLNIASSLMELQGGKLQLLLDGDLFKATLVFPSADQARRGE